jgi:hypothetical protein
MSKPLTEAQLNYRRLLASTVHVILQDELFQVSKLTVYWLQG